MLDRSSLKGAAAPPYAAPGVGAARWPLDGAAAVRYRTVAVPYLQGGRGERVPSGSYAIEIYGLAEPPLVCWPLSGMPSGPWDAEDLLPFLLPFVAVEPVIVPGASYSNAAPLLSYPALATFTHPDGHGPLTIAAVALVWLYDPPVLSSPPVEITPVTSPGPGWLVEVPIYRTITGPVDEE